LAFLLPIIYPNHPWDIGRLAFRTKPTKSSQRMFALTVQEIFPESEVHEDYIHQHLYFKSGQNIQFDVFLEQEKLAFEYQGEQHFRDIYALGSPQWKYVERDEEKRVECKAHGITLIEIPYWWDFEKESLLATIHSFRSDLISTPGKGIPI